MVVHAFPVAKLGALVLKQVSKPIAKFCQERAKSSPIFRKYVCIPPANFYNWCEIKMKMWILNLGKPVNIPVLNEAMAIELGASLLGEAIILIIASAILLAEYNRSARKEEKKEQMLLEERQGFTQAIADLYFLTQKQETEIKELSRLVYHLEGNVVQKPWAKKSPDDKSEPPPSSGPPIIIKSEILAEIAKKPIDGSTEKEEGTETDDKAKSGETKPDEMNPDDIKPDETTPDETKPVEGKPDERKPVEPRPPEEKPKMKCGKITENSSLITKAIAILEEDLWKSQDKEREASLLTNAINHIYKDVYRLPLRL